MNNGIILSKCKSTWRSKIDVQYLDETSRLKQQKMTLKGEAVGSKLKQFGDYASKEFLGQVHCAGFLWKEVGWQHNGSFVSPQILDNDHRKKRIVECWSSHLRKHGAPRGILQHRLVFSMSREFHGSLLASGLNPDAILHRSMKKVMRQFQERFHPGDKIGYAYGFHHDTDNLHVHVALCPRSFYGKYVGCSSQLKSKKTDNGQNDHLGYLKKCCQQENKLWSQRLGNPEAIRKTLQQVARNPRAGQYLVLPKIQNLPAQDMAAQRLRNLYSQLCRLDAELAALRLARTQRVSQRLTGNLFWQVPLKPVATLNRLLQGHSLRALQKQFMDLRRQYLEEYRKYSASETRYAVVQKQGIKI